MEISIGLSSLLPKYAFSTAVAYIIIIHIYRRFHDGNEFVFTYFMFNSLIFFFAYILGTMDINIGFAFGLFAVFAILRYRTDPIPIKEMTYLFIVITTGVINALSTEQVDFAELFFANAAIVTMTFLLERHWVNNLPDKSLNSKTIVYNDMNMIKPENHQELIKDLSEKTGLPVVDCKVGRINYIENRANVKLYYKD